MTLRFRPLRWPLLLLMLAALFLSACAQQIGNQNWPGMTAEGDIVYVAYGNGVEAVDVTARRALWRYPEGNARAPLMAAPAISGDLIYLADYGASQGFLIPGVRASVYALTADASGAPTLVQQNDDVARDRIVAAPVVADGKVVVGTADNQVVALNSTTLAEEWRFPVGHSVWGRPAIANDTIYVTSLDRTLYALNADGSERWKKEVGGAIAARPLVADDTVYVSSFDTRLYAFDAATGDERWTFAADDWLWNAPALAGDTLYFGDVSGAVYAVGTNGEERWRTSVDGAVEAGLVVLDDLVIVPTVIGVTSSGQSGQLRALSAADGSVIWTVELAQPVYVTPVQAGENVVILLQDTELGAFELRVYDREGRQQWAYAPGAQ